MFLNHILLGFLGIAFGGAVAAGTFAFVIVIGVVRALGGNVCRLYRGGSRRDIKHIPNPVPPGKTESGTAVGHVDDGGRQDVRGVLLFCEENRGRGVVGEV